MDQLRPLYSVNQFPVRPDVDIRIQYDHMLD